MIRMTLVVAALALAAAGCGGQVRMGAAATFADSPRISETDLASATRDWQTYYNAHPLDRSMLLLPDVDSVQGSVLAGLIGMRVNERTAKDRGIQISDAAVNQFLNQLTNGQPAKWDQVAMRYGVAPADSRRFARVVLVNERLAQGAAGDDAAVQQIHAALAETARKMGVKVNPRYGDSYAQAVPLGGLYPPVLQLSRPATGTGTATAGAA